MSAADTADAPKVRILKVGAPVVSTGVLQEAEGVRRRGIVGGLVSP
jgi:hypothetical protein